jgi:hypothetical protein
MGDEYEEEGRRGEKRGEWEEAEKMRRRVVGEEGLRRMIKRREKEKGQLKCEGGE